MSEEGQVDVVTSLTCEINAKLNGESLADAKLSIEGHVDGEICVRRMSEESQVEGEVRGYFGINAKLTGESQVDGEMSGTCETNAKL